MIGIKLPEWMAFHLISWEDEDKTAARKHRSVA